MTNWNLIIAGVVLVGAIAGAIVHVRAQEAQRPVAVEQSEAPQPSSGSFPTSDRYRQGSSIGG